MVKWVKKTIFSVLLLIFLIFFPSPLIIENQNTGNSLTRLKDKISPPKTSTSFNYNFAHLTGHAWEVRKVRFSPDGQILASGSHDGSIKLWDVASVWLYEWNVYHNFCYSNCFFYNRHINCLQTPQ